MEEEKQTKFTKLKNFINSLLWDLPFDNYHKLYKTGIIKTMDVEQKKQMLFQENNLMLKKIFFFRLIRLRPTILDDEDLNGLNKIQERKKYEMLAVIFGFMSLNALTFYSISIKKQKPLGKFFLANSFLILCFLHVNKKQETYLEKMFEKYDKIIVNEEMEEKMKMMLNKENNLNKN